MKKIVPFNNILEFPTDVKEITAISLEHNINKSKDIISGTFYINGEYKITEGSIEKEPFNFGLVIIISSGIAMFAYFVIKTTIKNIKRKQY